MEVPAIAARTKTHQKRYLKHYRNECLCALSNANAMCLLDRSLLEDFLRCLELPKNVTLLAL
jgi:hypothetical protein